ncbi:MAG TPA: hypothetical protein VMV10_09655 [Pirellulales bacterium]|nr:hypothetical protein [Pirellulales bacterium]
MADYINDIIYLEFGRWDALLAPPLSPYHYAPSAGQTLYRVQWQGPGLSPAAIRSSDFKANVKWPRVVLDDYSNEWDYDGSKKRRERGTALSALDWLSMYPDHPYWREAAALGLVMLAHSIAVRENRDHRHRQHLENRYDAGGADLFSRCLLAIVENLDKGLPDKIWGLRIERSLDEQPQKNKVHNTDWNQQNRLATVKANSKTTQEIRDACIRISPRSNTDKWRRSLVETFEPWQELSEKEDEARCERDKAEVKALWESCLTDERTRHVFALKAKRWTEREIAVEMGVKTGVVKRIKEKAYQEFCEKLGCEPTKRRTRAPGRDKPEPKPKRFTFDWSTLARLIESNARAASDFVRSVKRACVSDGPKCGGRDIVETGEPGSWAECVKAVTSCTDGPVTRQVMERVLARRWTADQIAAQLGIDTGKVKRLERKLRYEVCVRIGLDPMKCRVWELGTVEDEAGASEAA